MLHRGWQQGLAQLGLAIIVVGGLLTGGCHAAIADRQIDTSISSYRDRMLVQHQEQAAEQATPRGAQPVPWRPDLPAREALMTETGPDAIPTPQEILAQIPDPVEAAQIFEERLSQLRGAPQPDARVIGNYEKVKERALEYLQMVARPEQMRLSLAECVQRAIANNYSIRFEAYNPAISQTQLIEAQAAFDAEFFLDSSWSKLDQATTSAFVPSISDTRAIKGGFRKLLPTGMQVSTYISQQRTKNNMPPEYQLLNPSYSTSFVTAFTQPLLRGFGLDYNRRYILIAQAEHDIARERFIQKVRDTLLNVEQAYWALVEARRTAAILAESVAQNYVTYEGIWQRRLHDATRVELANSRARWRTREVEYQERIKNIRDAEDRLKSLLNDPDLLLSADLELIPTETPLVAALALDQLALVRTALDQRSEIREARRTIDRARIQTAAAKNETLPRLDLSFQYEVQGIGPSADSSFDNLTTNRFISYTVQAQFSYPIGNRARQAAHRRARLQESQSVVNLHAATDTIVNEVNTAVRALVVRHAQIPPQLDAVHAADSNMQAYQARTQKIDPLFLENELSAVERLAQARTTLLAVVTQYNTAIVGLEKAKGTLLDYNNVVVSDLQPER